MTARLALVACLAFVFLIAGCGGTHDLGNTGTIAGDTVGAGSHTEPADWSDGSARYHGAGHYTH